MKFLNETDRNNWKYSVLVLFRFQSVLVSFWDFQNPNFNDIEIFKSLTLITYKKKINREREVELLKNKENQESNGKRERRIIPIIKRSKEQSRTADDQKKLKWKKRGGRQQRQNWIGVECGGCLRVRMKIEKCELWGM